MELDTISDTINTDETIEIYDPKIDALFKTIFGNRNHKMITKRFLEDLLGLEIEDPDSINFLDKENLSVNYDPNQKKPIVDINIEIVEQKKQIDDKMPNIPKRIIIEMQVFNDSNLLNRCFYNLCKIFESYYFESNCNKSDANDANKKNDKSVEDFKIVENNNNEQNAEIYSLNFVYENKFKLGKDGEDNYFHKLSFFDSSNTINFFPNLSLYVIELSRFNIDKFKEINSNDIEQNRMGNNYKMERDYWIAFLKCITYEYKVDERIVNCHLTKDLYNILTKINEIEEAIDLYLKSKVKKPHYYDNYLNLIFSDKEDIYWEKEYEKVKQLKDDMIEMKKNCGVQLENNKKDAVFINNISDNIKVMLNNINNYEDNVDTLRREIDILENLLKTFFYRIF